MSNNANEMEFSNKLDKISKFLMYGSAVDLTLCLIDFLIALIVHLL